MLESVRQARLTPDQRVVDLAVDLADPGAPDAVMDRAVEEFGQWRSRTCRPEPRVGACSGPGVLAVLEGVPEVAGLPAVPEVAGLPALPGVLAGVVTAPRSHLDSAGTNDFQARGPRWG